MKRILFIILFLVAAAPVLAGETIAIMDLKPIGVSKSLAEAVSENIRTMLIISEAFQVVEREQLGKILAEHNLSQSGVTENQDAVKIGGLAESNLIMIGSITKMFDSYTINARLLNVKSGVCALAQKVAINSEAEFPGKIDELALFFSDKATIAATPTGTPDINGTYRVKGSDYVGKLHVEKQGEVYRINWLIDNSQTSETDQIFEGVGILHNNMLSVNYSERDDKMNTGVAIYDVHLNGKRIRGLYANVNESKTTGKLHFENGEKIEK